MPIYEYWCPKCSKEFELIRPLSEAGESAKCPKCGTKSEKLVSLFASKENYTIKVPTGSAFRGNNEHSRSESAGVRGRGGANKTAGAAKNAKKR